MMKINLILLLSLLLFSCRSSKEIAARKAAKEEAARQAEMAILQKVRQQLPCDPVKIIEGKTIYLPGDSVPYPVYINGDTVIKWAKCPPSTIRVDTFVKIDNAALQAARDSLESSDYRWMQLLDEYNKEVARADKAEQQVKTEKDDKAYWKIRAIGTWVVLGLLAGGAIFSKIKGLI